MNVKLLAFIKKAIKAIMPYGIIMLLYRRNKKFPGSKKYWEKRYANGGNSGAGSYNRLAEFKAEVINNFVKNNSIKTVMEFGCGDGNQLSLAHYPQYKGFDVSETAIKLCKNRFKKDTTKTFYLLEEYTNTEKAEIVLSLDVIYHLVEDVIFEEYIDRLFESSTKFVIIYACDFDEENNFHEKPRKFTKYIETKIKGWNLLEHIPNKFPYNKNDPNNTSRSDFYIYKIEVQL